jgi:hypothetical protein
MFWLADLAYSKIRQKIGDIVKVDEVDPELSVICLTCQIIKSLKRKTIKWLN